MKDLLKRELIGYPIAVTQSHNSAQIGIKGTIVDETRSTLVVEGDGGRGRKRLMKKGMKIEMTYHDGARYRIDCSYLVGRPEDRIKTAR